VLEADSATFSVTLSITDARTSTRMRSRVETEYNLASRRAAEDSLTLNRFLRVSTRPALRQV